MIINLNSALDVLRIK